MLKYFISKVCGRYIFAPRIMICIPSRVTEVEKRAVIDAAIGAGARKVYLIEEPLAAAIGAGLDVSRPSGNMVVDIGGGTTDIAIISLGGTVISTSIKVAGDKFDEAIVKYIRKKYTVLIGDRTAEDIKIDIGCVYPKIQDLDMNINGNNTSNSSNSNQNKDEKYTTIERSLLSAAKKYARENELDDDEIIESDTLIDEGYLTPTKMTNEEDICDGYVTKQNSSYKAYISCESYETKGY